MTANGKHSRRSMLRLGWQTVAAAGIAGSLESAWGQAGNGYRALVCIYLMGGNDSNNMIVPLDPDEYREYAAIRGDLALSRSSLLPIRCADGGVYGLHPALAELRDLYNDGKLAVAANVGEAASRTSDGHEPGTGWSYREHGFLCPAWAARWAQTAGSSQVFYGFGSGTSFIAPGSSLTSGSHFENDGMRRETEMVSMSVRFPATEFGRAMRDAAALVKIGPAWGMARQIFTVTMAGFDTHRDQLNRQARLFRNLSRAVSAFYRNVDAFGLADRVTIYTDTEFNRSLRPNSKGGTEHGWSGHQLVAGGAIRGGNVYGEFPTFQSAADSWRPSLDRERLAAELSRWAGASVSDVYHLFPQARGHRALGLFA